MSYTAFITRLTAVRPHPNADRIKLATVMGSQVVVGLDAKDGDIGVFFPEGGQLSEAFVENNFLYNASARRSLGLPEAATGFFDLNRRVRAQSFRGAKSEGFFTALTSLAYLNPDYSTLEPGTAFSQVNGIDVCQKYETPQQRTARTQNRRSVRRGETVMFKKHVDTAQFAYYADQIPPGSLITLTEKLHGTSGRLTRALEPHPTCWYHRLLGLRPGASWTVLHGTRNVILEHSTGTGFYGDETFRYDAVADILPRKGETLFFELVGYTTGGGPIMPAQAIPVKELPDLAKAYGDTMRWDYGQPVGSCGLYVYRITQTNEDGYTVELSWPQVKARCAELGINHVPELMGAPFFYPIDHPDAMAFLEEIVHMVTKGASTLDASQIREGCCLRIDTPDGRTYWLKNKSYEFKVLEGIIRLDDTYVDTEEAA